MKTNENQKELKDAYEYTVYVKNITEQWIRVILTLFQNVCHAWLQVTVVVEKVRAFFKGNAKRSCDKEEPQNDDEDEYKIEKIIPKAIGMPIFGTYFDLRTAGGAEQLHNYIDGRHHLLGDIFQERLGGSSETLVFVASASLMRSVFLYEGQYPRHPLPEAWKIYNEHFNCQRGLLFMDGEEWFHNRRILNRFLLNGNLSWMDDHIKLSTAKLILSLKYESGSTKSFRPVYNLEHRLFRWAVDVICTIMFGPIAMDYPNLEDKMETFSEVVRNVFEKSTALMNFPPKLAKLLRLRIWKDFEHNVKKVLSLSGEIIDMFVAINADGNSTNSGMNDTDTLFKLLEDAKMPLSMIKRIFVDLVIAAGDTTAYTSIWALFLVASEVEMQKRIFKDVQEHGDMSPLVHGLIKETLRLYPVAPFIGRYITSDAVIEGYKIPKDTLVLLSLYTAGRDERHFPQPFDAKPERWLRNPKTGEFKNVLQAHGTLPFAIGNRSCIGRKVAMKQLHFLLSEMISHFQMKYNYNELLEPILRMVTVPHIPLKITIKSRE